jgi:hypothetical protein
MKPKINNKLKHKLNKKSKSSILRIKQITMLKHNKWKHKKIQNNKLLNLCHK